MDARTLLKEHPARCTRICNLKVMIRYQRKSLRQDEKSIIEMMALARTPLDGMPHAGHGGSRTEYVVLNKDKVMQAAKQDVEAHIQRLQCELSELKYYEQLYESCIMNLTAVEREIVELHYHKGSSVESIAAMQLNGQTYSSATIWRMIKRILEKTQAAIDV